MRGITLRLVMSTDPALAQREAVRLAQEFWPNRHRMQGKFISIERAIAQMNERADERPAPLRGLRSDVRRALGEFAKTMNDRNPRERYATAAALAELERAGIVRRTPIGDDDGLWQRIA